MSAIAGAHIAIKKELSGLRADISKLADEVGMTTLTKDHVRVHSARRRRALSPRRCAGAQAVGALVPRAAHPAALEGQAHLHPRQDRSLVARGARRGAQVLPRQPDARRRGSADLSDLG